MRFIASARPSMRRILKMLTERSSEMTHVMRRDPVSDPPGRKFATRPADASSAQDRHDAPPRTDVGTIFLHWATAIAFVVSLFTGIRIATFGYVLPTLSQWLSPIMPQGEMWTWHFFAGLGLFFCASAYLLYLNRSGLTARNALKKVRMVLMAVPSKMRWQAINVGLHWFVYALITVMTVTGVILYLGY